MLFLRPVQARSEPGVMEQPPEVVPRVCEVRAGGVQPAPRVDAAEDDLEAGRQNVRDGALGDGVHLLDRTERRRT